MQLGNFNVEFEEKNDEVFKHTLSRESCEIKVMLKKSCTTIKY